MIYYFLKYDPYPRSRKEIMFVPTDLAIISTLVLLKRINPIIPLINTLDLNYFTQIFSVKDI